MKIETDRLIIRKIEENDFVSFKQYYAHPELGQYIYGQNGIADADIRHVFEYNLKLQLSWSVILKDNNEIIGNIHLTNIADNYIAEVGYILDPNHWGMGYMTEVLTAVTDFAFNDFGLAKVMAITEAANTYSVNLLKRCGFMHEATINEAAYNGRLVDLSYYFIKKDEGNKSQQELLNSLSSSASLSKIQAYIKQILLARGITSGPVQHSLLLLCEEVGELAKAIRKNTIGMSFDKNSKLDSAESELADILIVVCEIANILNIDLYDAFIAKEQVNVGRNWDFTGAGSL